MKTIKLIADYFYETGDLVRTKEGKRCLLLDISDTIFTTGSYMPTSYISSSIDGTSNYVIATCEVMP
jgi:hypothetical protein